MSFVPKQQVGKDALSEKLSRLVLVSGTFCDPTQLLGHFF
jgi:hypothetical protein